MTPECVACLIQRELNENKQAETATAALLRVRLCDIDRMTH